MLIPAASLPSARTPKVHMCVLATRASPGMESNVGMSTNAPRTMAVATLMHIVSTPRVPLRYLLNRDDFVKVPDCSMQL